MNFSFADEYKNWNNAELFDLLKNKQQYQMDAVIAAENEFNSRNLTELELDWLEKQFSEKLNKKQNSFEKRVGKKLNAAGEMFLNEMDILSDKTADRKFRWFCYSVGLLVIFLLIYQFPAIKWNFKYGINNGLDALLVSQFFFAPAGLYFFWKKKTFGWKILSVWLVIFLVLGIVGFYNEIIFYKEVSSEPFMQQLRNSFRPNYVQQITGIVLLAGFVIYINTTNITGYFKLNRRSQWLTVGITAVLSFIYFITM